MFWIVLIIIVIVIIIWDVINGTTNKAGKSFGLTEEETNDFLDLWAIFHIGKTIKINKEIYWI